MPTGRKKKPDEIKRLEGNPGKRPLNGSAPMPTGCAAKPPYVTGHAAAVWDQITSSMPPNLYTAVDSVVLAAFCVASGQYRTATETLAAEGLTVVSAVSGDEKPHPALQAQTKALTAISLLGARLGLDPSSRASIVMPRAAKLANKFEGLLGVKSESKKAGA